MDFNEYRDDPLSRYLVVMGELVDLAGELAMVESDYERNRIMHFQQNMAQASSIAEAQRATEFQTVQELHEVTLLRGQIRAKEYERDALLMMVRLGE